MTTTLTSLNFYVNINLARFNCILICLVIADTDSDVAQRSYLISNWINKDIAEHKLRFKFTNNTQDHFDLKVFILNEEMEQQEVQTIQEEENVCSSFIIQI